MSIKHAGDRNLIKLAALRGVCLQAQGRSFHSTCALNTHVSSETRVRENARLTISGTLQITLLLPRDAISTKCDWTVIMFRNMLCDRLLSVPLQMQKSAHHIKLRTEGCCSQLDQRSCNRQPSRLQQPAQRIKSTTATPAVISFNLF
jgi:hypothetical protein